MTKGSSGVTLENPFLAHRQRCGSEPLPHRCPQSPGLRRTRTVQGCPVKVLPVQLRNKYSVDFPSFTGSKLPTDTPGGGSTSENLLARTQGSRYLKTKRPQLQNVRFNGSKAKRKTSWRPHMQVYRWRSRAIWNGQVEAV